MKAKIGEYKKQKMKDELRLKLQANLQKQVVAARMQDLLEMEMRL